MTKKRIDSWIDIDDVKPPYDTHILLCDCHGWVSTGYYTKSKYSEDFFEYANGEESGCRVTHWMHLPLLPKRDEDET